MTYIFSALILAALAFLIWKQSQTTEGGVNREIGRLQSQIEEVKKEKDELAGNGKQLFSRFKDLEAEHKSLQRERDEKSSALHRYEESEERRRREHDDQLQKLHRAEKSFEDEKMRIRHDDEERLQKMLEERDRLWNDHEQNVLASLIDLCKKPETSFAWFDNKNLPDGFDGSVKPDFMIAFLKQYIVFDAKVSRSDNFQNYISTNVKKTAEKYKGNVSIYPTVFFVVPTDAISELKKLSFTENGLTFYVISPESLEPILASLKKITTYEFAEQLDPQEREKIIHLVASLDYHISERNAFDVLMAQRGSAVLYDAKKLYPEISDEVHREKEKMRLPNFRPSDLKRLIANIDERDREIEDLTAPKPEVSKRDMKRMQEALLDV
ncbi:MAG TPA: hypothetical protein VJB82_00825 [Candidatus Peribacterales bacterium]|nr:hypothetical protein [Candidatus Peribacterales bacterium]